MMSFNLEQFLGVLEQYNVAMWPLHIFASVLGIAAVFCAVKKTKYSDKIIMLILSLYWFWNGVVFCFMYWSRVYPFANVFGVLLVIQGILFLGNSMKSKLSFRFRGDVHSSFGIIFLLYAMIGYSVLGQFLGHV